MSWYCPLPFTSLSSDTAGYYALCCESNPAPYHCNNMSLKDSLDKGTEMSSKVIQQIGARL